MKPQLAKDVDLDTMIYPCWGMPKIDGVRGLNSDGNFTGRSLEPFTGYGQTEFWSDEALAGLDGEMIAGFDPASPDLLCNRSTSAMGTFKGVTERAETSWWIFDDVSNPALPYHARYNAAMQRVRTLKQDYPDTWGRYLFVVGHEVIRNKVEAERYISECLDEGYEGAIFRNPDAPAKPDRPTKKGQELMRYKPWMDSEMLVTGLTEGTTNLNEATTNALGRTERSSHKENKEANGTVGSIQGVILKDVHHPITGKLLFAKDLQITIGPGKLTAAMRKNLWKHQDLIVNHVVKFQHMAHGVKDLPRFGAYVSHRLKQDM